MLLLSDLCYTAQMTDELSGRAKQIGDEIIDISTSLDKKMDKWSDLPTRPDSLGPTERVGFINKATATSGLNLVVDIQVPADKDEALLRTWAIESKPDDDRIERFSNIQLNFIVSYSQARELAKKAGDVTYNDIRAMLHDKNTQLAHVVVSDQSGFNEESQQTLGKRYDLTVNELDGHQDIIDTVSDALNNVLLTLKKSAIAETTP